MPYFDHFAESKSTKIGKLLHNRKTKRDFRYICKYLRSKNCDILEIGPGKGDLAKVFLKNGYKNYDVVEPNINMNKLMKNIGVRKVSNYKIPTLNEIDESYDIILCFDVYEHLNNSNEAETFISESERVLKKRGMIIILSPDYLDWRNDFFNCDYTHNNITTVRRIIQIFYNNNLNTFEYKYFYSFLEGVIGIIISKLIKVLTLFYKGNSINSKIYKLRLTFLRRFIIVGKKLYS